MQTNYETRQTAQGWWIINGDSHIGAWIEQAKRLDHDQSSLPIILRHIVEGGIVVDAGSFIGTHCWAYLQKVGPTGQVICYEPFPEAFQCLRKNCPDALCFMAALWNRNTIGRLVPPGDTNWGTMRVEEDPQGDVALLTLDSQNWDKVNLVKIDCEGTELRVLKGAQETIKRTRPVLVVEVHEGLLRSNGASPSELIEFIKSMNYKVENIFPRNDMDGPQWDALCTPI